VSLSAPRRYRLALTAILAVAVLAMAYVAVVRVNKETHARQVEIAIDYGDFAALSRSYGYDESQFLIALRRAGLTSLAVQEELGASIDSGQSAAIYPGQQLINAARLSPLTDPVLGRLSRAGALRSDTVYLVVYDRTELPRYERAIALHLEPKALTVIADPGARATILAIRSQSDFLYGLGFGLPGHPRALASGLGLYLVPRYQNDERFGPSQIAELFADAKRGERPSTMIFFGARNEVLGFPDHLKDVADAFKSSFINYGAIETYDEKQVQKGNDELGRLAIERTARVQAISKTEQDKLDFRTIVARYLLGVRERNVRVVYLRPVLHAETGDASASGATFSLEKTNVELVRQIAEGLRARGFVLGRATPIPAFAINPLVIIVASLAVPAILLLLLEAFGVRRPKIAYYVFGADLLAFAAGYATHHDLAVRKLAALTGAIAFATMSVVAIPRAFTAPEPARLGAALLAGLRTAGVALGFALLGALCVVGLLSIPLLMEEIDRFSGVKAVIIVPPILAFALYVYTRRFGSDATNARASAVAPVRVYQLAVLAALAGAAALYVMRSGNQSDIAPSAFELSLRSGLTAALGIRPRFKEFAIGFPLLMLLPSLRLAHRRAVGWLFAIGIAIGTADIVDTFSHLHTPLAVSALRLLNGAVLGIAIGAIAVIVYRAIVARRLAPRARVAA